MKYITYILIFALVVFSCSNSIEEKKEQSLIVNIDGWDVNVEKGITDTLNTENWIPKSELSFQFINKSDSTCLKPNLEFYPIELEEHIEQKLTKYLLLRAYSFPPAPNTYSTDKHYIIGWNLISYGDYICCDCLKLESDLIEKLKMKVKAKPIKLELTK